MNRTYLFTLLFGIVPISELRGAIPFGYFNGIPLYLAIILGIGSNLLVYPICIFFLNHINDFLCHHIKKYNSFYLKMKKNAIKRINKKILKFGYLGLMVFVGIPLPITGAWTATLGSWILNLDQRKSLLFISLGVLMSGAIIGTILFMGVGFNSIFLKRV
ncbi:MAG: small multi-drug export protein [Sphaerochaetaceae bacterium]|nr:small multi-drug export protein [Sphaerochaetaceae bacterium]